MEEKTKRRMPPSGPAIRDIDMDRLDQRRALIYGVGVFSGIVTALFPLSVVKTRQMASPDVDPGFKGALQTARLLYKNEGVAGFYRGFGTVVSGAIPARMIYLPTLEFTRATMKGPLEEHLPGLSPAASASICHGLGGAVGSVASSAVVVPMDVVSSRLMVTDRNPAAQSSQAISGNAASITAPRAQSPTSTSVVAPPQRSPSTQVTPCLAKSPDRQMFSSRPAHLSHSSAESTAAAAARARSSGWHMAQHILRTEGIAGLYRGLGISLLTYTPSSAVWWASYSAVQEGLWQSLYSLGADVGEEDYLAIILVQSTSAFAGGCISGTLTTPLDVIKTQLQVAGRNSATARLTMLQLVQQVYQREGVRGFWRGVVPRASSVALWGTCMATAYESLKRLCVIEEPSQRSS